MAHSTGSQERRRDECREFEDRTQRVEEVSTPAHKDPGTRSCTSDRVSFPGWLYTTHLLDDQKPPNRSFGDHPYLLTGKGLPSLFLTVTGRLRPRY